MCVGIVIVGELFPKSFQSLEILGNFGNLYEGTEGSVTICDILQKQQKHERKKRYLENKFSQNWKMKRIRTVIFFFLEILEILEKKGLR